MPRPYRAEKVAELIKQEMGKILIYEVKDPRLQGILTVTNVRVSPDLRHAKVYVSVFGDEEKRKVVEEALNHAKGFIRSLIARRIRLRFAPEIDFVIDRSIEEGTKVLKIMADIGLREIGATEKKREEGEVEEVAEGTAPEDEAGNGESQGA